MPMTDDIQPAIDDLGAQLEAEFASREVSDTNEDRPAAAGDEASPVVDTSADAAAAGDAEHGEPAAAAHDGLIVDLDGRQFTVTAQHAERLVKLQAWAEALPEPVREQFAEIETGAAVAVPKAEYEAFQQWRKQGGDSAPAGDIDLADLDPDTAAYVARVQAENDALRAQQQGAIAQQQQSGMSAIAETIDTVAARFAERHGLTPDELEQVQAQAAQLQIIPQLVNAGRTYSPSGVLIADADYAQVFEQAFEAGIAAHPTLRTKFVEAEVARRLAAERSANEAVDGKRSRASSLASVPSAALPRDPSAKPLSQQAMTAAIAAEVRRSMNGGGEN